MPVVPVPLPLATACSSDVDVVASGSGSGAGGSGSGVGSGGGGDPWTFDCAASAGDHSAECADPCPIVDDVVVSCQDNRPVYPGLSFSLYGLHVAAGADAMYLLGEGTLEDAVFELADGAGQHRQELTPDRGDYWMDVAANGRLELAWEGAGVNWLADEGGSVATATVYEGTRVEGFQLLADGSRKVWHGITGNHEESTGTPEGSWSSKSINPPQDSWHAFYETADGTTVAFGSDGDELWVDEGQGAARIGPAAVDFVPALHYRVARHPVVMTASLPVSFAVAIHLRDAIHVAWPSTTSTGYDTIAVPTSGYPDLQCEAIFSMDQCGGSCDEDATGVERSSYGVTYTADGKLWVAFFERHIKHSVTTSLEMFEFGEQCVGNYTNEDNSARLRIFEVTTDGPPPPAKP